MSARHRALFSSVMDRYHASDADIEGLYIDLFEHGAAGRVAVNLIRAHRSSTAAKRRGHTGYRPKRKKLYDRKNDAIDRLCDALLHHTLTFGWKVDPERVRHEHVLFVDLPTGQVSFHTGERGKGPDYAGVWDGAREQSLQRICLFAAQLLYRERRAA